MSSLLSWREKPALRSDPRLFRVIKEAKYEVHVDPYRGTSPYFLVTYTIRYDADTAADCNGKDDHEGHNKDRGGGKWPDNDGRGGKEEATPFHRPHCHHPAAIGRSNRHQMC